MENASRFAQRLSKKQALIKGTHQASSVYWEEPHPTPDTEWQEDQDEHWRSSCGNQAVFPVTFMRKHFDLFFSMENLIYNWNLSYRNHFGDNDLGRKQIRV